MTTLNTIIEEEKKSFNERFVNWKEDPEFWKEDIKDTFTTAMQRAHEAGVQNTIKEVERIGVPDTLVATGEPCFVVKESLLKGITSTTTRQEVTAKYMNTPDIEWEKEFDAILDGIDKDECEYKNGWWETSTGAEFGGKKKVELKTLITKMLTSRDTYWKERVREVVDGLKGRRHPNDLFFQNCPNCGEMANEKFVADKFVEVWDEALDTLLDNLK